MSCWFPVETAVETPEGSLVLRMMSPAVTTANGMLESSICAIRHQILPTIRRSRYPEFSMSERLVSTSRGSCLEPSMTTDISPVATPGSGSAETTNTWIPEVRVTVSILLLFVGGSQTTLGLVRLRIFPLFLFAVLAEPSSRLVGTRVTGFADGRPRDHRSGPRYKRLDGFGVSSHAFPSRALESSLLLLRVALSFEPRAVGCAAHSPPPLL